MLLYSSGCFTLRGFYVELKVRYYPHVQFPIPLPLRFALRDPFMYYIYRSKSGLYPTDDLEAAKCDAVMDSCGELTTKARLWLFEKDDESKVH